MTLPVSLASLGFERGRSYGYYLDGALLLLMMVALSVEGATLFVFGGMQFTLTHAAIGLLGAYIFFRCIRAGHGLKLPSAPINVLLGTFVIITLIDTPRYGFGALLLKYVFQYLVILVMVNFYGLLGAERSRRLIVTGACVVLALILVNAAVHYQAFAYYYANPWDGHPNYATLFSGGVNLEATWPALFGVFFEGDRRGRIYLGCVFLFSVLVASRAGLLLSVGAALYVLFLKGRRIGKRVWMTLGALVGIAVLAIALGIALHVPMFERMASIGEDSGSWGRLSIWSNAVTVFRSAPFFGVGAGHAMDWVRAVSAHPFPEDNVHMYPLQILVDFGLAGLAVFAVVVARFVIKNARTRFRSPFAAFVLLYLMISLIQFRGGELLLGFVLAGVCAFGVMDEGSGGGCSVAAGDADNAGDAFDDEDERVSRHESHHRMHHAPQHMATGHRHHKEHAHEGKPRHLRVDAGEGDR